MTIVRATHLTTCLCTVNLRRRAFTLLEVSVSGALLIVLMVITAQLLGWVIAERRATDRRLWATAAAENAIERLSTLPWNDLTAERAAAEQLPPDTLSLLPEAELQVELINENDGLESKRISVVVRWQRRPGDWAAPVRLSGWVYRGAEANR